MYCLEDIQLPITYLNIQSWKINWHDIFYANNGTQSIIGAKEHKSCSTEINDICHFQYKSIFAIIYFTYIVHNMIRRTKAVNFNLFQVSKHYKPDLFLLI